MTLDSHSAEVVSQVAEANEGLPPIAEIPPEALREGFKPMVAYQGEPQEAGVEDRTIDGPAGPLQIRIFSPVAGATKDGPGLFFIHGGGWVIMDLDSHDPLCRKLANDLGAVVVAVHYRRAPEAKFPAPLDDCWSALNYVVDNAADLSIDSQRIAIAGDSAGGNLAAAITLRAKDNNGPHIAAQVLHVPVTDFDFGTKSYSNNAEDYFLTQEMMRFFWDQYLTNPSQGTNPLASPLKAKDLSGLPPALVQTCEYDPLRDEGAAYARRLQEADVETTHTDIPGTIHDPFVMFAALPKGAAAIDEAVSFLRNKIG